MAPLVLVADTPHHILPSRGCRRNDGGVTFATHVHDSDMPQLFQAADRASIKAQRSYIKGTLLRLLALAVAAVLGVFSWRVGAGRIDVWGIAGVIAFIVAILVELNTWRMRPDKGWYDGRAVAESAKTLAWKFAVGALPFPKTLEANAARHALLERLESVRSEFSGLQLEVSTSPAISDWMIRQRESTLSDRRASYLRARIDNQKTWYAGKATYNKRRAQKARVVLIGMELLGVSASLLCALNQGVLVISPAIATIIVGILAWIEAKQYDFNARAYSAAVNDLAYAEEKLKLATSEESWAKEVDDAEEAISGSS